MKMLLKKYLVLMIQLKATDFGTNITGIENRLLDTSCLVTKTSFIANMTEIENKIPNTSSLVKKPDFKITGIDNNTRTNFGTNVTEVDNKMLI